MTFPSPLRFARAILRALGLWFFGPLTVSDEVRDARRATCAACPFYDPEWDQCRKCGCFLVLKVELSAEECPEGKWRKSLTPWSLISTLYQPYARRLKGRQKRPGQ